MSNERIQWIAAHCEPDRGDIERNKLREPLGEEIRAAFEGLIEKYGISSMIIDTANNRLEIDVNILPPRTKSVLTLWGSIRVIDRDLTPEAPRPDATLDVEASRKVKD